MALYTLEEEDNKAGYENEPFNFYLLQYASTIKRRNHPADQNEKPQYIKVKRKLKARVFRFLDTRKGYWSRNYHLTLWVSVSS